MMLRKIFPVLLLLSLSLAACSSETHAASPGTLKVVASTTIVGDVVAQVAGDLIDLTVLFPTGADPHTFEPRPQDVAAISEADVIFLNGLGLEEALEPTLEANARGQVIHVSEGIDVLAFASDEHEDEEQEGEDGHANGDPHTWTNPNNVIIWTHNIASALSKADPEHAGAYQANAETYTNKLRELDTWIQSQLKTLPEGQRKMVTDHATLGYFADEYGFEQIGMVVAGLSTNAAPSAKEIADLIDAVKDYDVPAIFVGTSVNPSLAEQVAQDTGVQLVSIYTGSLSEAGGEADSYLKFMRYNVNAIVNALK